MVVAADLARDPQNAKQIVVGNETRAVCDHAARLHLADPEGSVLVMTAGDAPAYDHQWMADIMSDYIATRYHDIRAKHLFRERAKTFNTYGEMLALAAAMRAQRELHPALFEEFQVTLAVRWWHAPRAQLLCEHCIRKKMRPTHFKAVPVVVKECFNVAPPSRLTRIRERLALAHARNIIARG